MKQDSSKYHGSEEARGARGQQQASRPAPGKVTLTSKLPGDHQPAIQRKRAASAPGASAPQARSPGELTADSWLDAAHRGLTAFSERELAPVQARGNLEDDDPASVHDAAAAGVSGIGSALPHLARIQTAFGDHELGDVRAHVDGEARQASEHMGAEAYATGNDIAFRSQPDLHTAAHEAAHVVQQRAGVQLQGGVGQAGDAYEQHADAVADAVVAGQSAQPMLDAMPPGAGDAGGHAAVQRQEQPPSGAGEELQERARQHAQRIRDALGRTFLIVFSDPDGQAVYQALTQPADLVRAIRDVYDTQFNTLSGRGLVADLKQAFRGQDLELMAALLTRAGVPVGDIPLTYLEQNPDGSHATQTRIVAEPAHPSVPPGASVRYRLARGAEMYSTDSYYSYQWYCLNDPSTRDRHGGPARFDGPTTAVWDATWDFPGEHTVVCRVQFHPGGGSPRAPEFVEYRQRVRPIEDIAADAFARSESADFVRFRAGLEMRHLDLTQNGVADQNFGGTHIQNSGPNPAVPGIAPNLSHHTYTVVPMQGATQFRWYALCDDMASMPTESHFGFRRIDAGGRPAYAMGEGTSASWIIARRNVYTIVCEQRDETGQLLGTATYRQVVHSEEEQRVVENWRGYMARVDQQIQSIDASRRVGIRASYVNRETGAVVSPSLFIGPDAHQPGQLKLLDLTPGIDRIEYGGTDVEAALADFDRGNSYPTGRLTLEISANEAGIAPLSRVIDTDGSSDWATWAGNLGWASLGLALAGVAASVIPGGQVVAPALFVAAAGAGVASGGLSIYDELQQAEVSGTSIAIDVLGIASSIIGGAAAFRTARQGVRVALANRGTQYLLYTGLALDGASGVLLTVEAFGQIAAILDSQMPEGEKISAVVRTLASLAINGGLIALSVRDARQARGRVSGLLGSDALNGVADDVARNLDALDDDALRALRGATPAQLGQIGQLATRSPTTMSRFIRLMGLDILQHEIIEVDGLLRINGQLDIHPTSLAQIVDADLVAILNATRSGDTAALERFTKSGRVPRLRFHYQLQAADDFIDRVLDGAGIPATDPQRVRLFGTMDNASRQRLFDLRNKSYPGGVKDALSQRAASYALQKNPATVREFVEHFEMFTSEFERLVTEAKVVEGLNGRSWKEFYQAVLARMDDAQVHARYTELLGQLGGRTGAGRIGSFTTDAELVAQVRGLPDVRFGSQPAAAYHANKHHQELPPTHRQAGSDFVTQYLDSANRTIQEGAPEVSIAQNGNRSIVFTHTYTDGQPPSSITMVARVYVNPTGNAVLATYGKVN
jgi:hypothetical protein